VNKRIIAISFREGVLFTYVPKEADANQLLEWLSHRDSVIRTLLSQRLPVLTPVAAMVADLQNSVRICSELPPDEYFQLINEIWSTLDPIFREYYGAYGKHTGDGMVYYFFPQPDNNYIMNAILCACKIRESMRVISHKWALKKGWTNQLFMNIGLNEGEEWLGTFKTNTSYELVVLGETINICGRLSDFARYGEIWATKNLVSKLNHAERDSIDYGVARRTLEQEIFVSNSYAQISTLIDKEDLRHIKLLDISSTAVTQIRAIK
jgi:class 3 adenylate cyclase